MEDLLIECPFCTKKITSRAKKCPNCLEWIDDKVKADLVKKETDKILVNKQASVGCFLLIACFVGLLIFQVDFWIAFLITSFASAIVSIVIQSKQDNPSSTIMSLLKKRSESLPKTKFNIRSLNIFDKAFFLIDIKESTAEQVYNEGKSVFVGEDIKIPKISSMVEVNKSKAFGKTFNELLGTIKNNRFKNKNTLLYREGNLIEKSGASIVPIFLLLFGLIATAVIVEVIISPPPPPKDFSSGNNYQPVEKSVSQYTPAQALTLLDTNRQEQGYIDKIDYYLEKCRAFKGNPSKETLANMTAKSKQMLKDKGHDMSNFEILVMSDRFEYKNLMTYPEFLASIVTITDKK